MTQTNVQTTSQPTGLASAVYAGPLLMIAAGILFAFDNILTQAATMTFAQKPATVAFWQYFAALIFSLPLLFRLRAGLGTSALPQHILRVALAAAGVQLWVMGLAVVPIWQAIALIMTSPFFVTLGAGLLLGERVTPARWIAVTLGFVGGMIILAPWSDAFTPAVLYPLGAAALWAAQSLMTKRMTATENPESLTVYMLLLLAPINALVAAPSGFHLDTGQPLLAVIAAGLVTAGAQYLLVRAYAVADAAYLQPFDHLKLPLNVLFGFLAFGFLPVGSMWLGSALILAASAWLVGLESRRT